MEENQLTAITIFKKDDVIAKFQELLGKRASSYLTSVMSIVSQNYLLSKADPKSIYLAALTSATLDLPINPNLGFAYIIPFSGKAQFQIGYKGMIQLALRSGQFENIDSKEVYEGQIEETDDTFAGYKFRRSNKKSDVIVGYAAYFKLLNGFHKTFYMTKQELEKHGQKFSQTFKKGTGLRKDDFDTMAKKTVLKLLISKFAPLSVEMQKAIVADQGVIEDENLDGIEYPDNDENIINDMDVKEKLKDFTSSN